MSSDQQGHRDDVSAETAALEAEFFGRRPEGRIGERVLWAYALGSLSLEDEDRVQEWLAGNAAAQQTLARIQASLEPKAEDAVGVEAAENPAALAVRRLLAAVGELRKEIAVALSWVEGALVVDSSLSKWRPAYAPAAVLGEPEPGSARGGAALPEFGSKGVRVRLIVVKPPRVNVEIEIEGMAAGEVEAFRLERGNRRVGLAGRPLGGGKTLFERCLPGLFEFVLPSGEPFLVAIAAGEDAILPGD